MHVKFNDIKKAAKLLAGKIELTPCIPSRVLSKLTGADIFLKFENLQFTGSFKDRGALIKLLEHQAKHPGTGVVAMSAGNHAQAVAYHAQQLQIPAVIIMPKYTPSLKVEHTRSFGAEVILHGNNLEESAAFAEKIVGERKLSLIHPYNDPAVIAGQGTIGLEMLAAIPDLEFLVVPVGGGGLISGIAVAAKNINPDVKIIGIETCRFPSMLSAIKGEEATFGRSSLAEGIAVKQPGELTLQLVKEYVDEILLVDEEEIERAVLLLLEVEKTVTEGAGAVGLAAVLKHTETFHHHKVGIVISGGNIDLSTLATIIQRGLVRSGRLVRLKVDIKDHPGGLADITRRLGEADANIVQIDHQRAFTHLPLQIAEVQFTLQTRGLDHVQEVIRSLTAAGYELEIDASFQTLQQQLP